MPKCWRKSVLNVRVRSANRADIPAIVELNHQSPTAAQWSVQQYESLFAEVNLQLSQRVILVAEDVSETLPEITSGAHRVHAFLVVLRVDKEWEVENIAVDEKSRRLGVGSRLLSDFIELARSKNANAIFLEVRQSNQAARALYKKFGFVDAGTRKSYYSNPSEDAVVYRLSLSHNETAPQIWH
jgi:ribosomal-protein-alanine acetyltransferase